MNDFCTGRSSRDYPVPIHRKDNEPADILGYLRMGAGEKLWNRAIKPTVTQVMAP
jgi:hypothetical protein